jgi:hypothetical protein
MLGWMTHHLSLQLPAEALNLAHRYEEGGTFRLYVNRRLPLVIPAVILVLLIGLACTFATIVFLAGKYFLLTLLAFLLVPVVFTGSLLVQAYVLFSWLEGRALARALRHRAPPARTRLAAWLHSKLGAEMGPVPPVPWLWAVLLLFAPLALLVSLVWQAAMLLIVLGMVAPILFARFDR